MDPGLPHGSSPWAEGPREDNTLAALGGGLGRCEFLTQSGSELSTLEQFLKLEAAGGIVLCVAAALTWGDAEALRHCGTSPRRSLARSRGRRLRVPRATLWRWHPRERASRRGATTSRQTRS